ncbi:MAG: hypothetical protein AB7G13_16295 [Lautropia sp.]
MALSAATLVATFAASPAAAARRLSALLLSAVAVAAAADEPLRNWFDDPFFQVSADIADCPEPAGPRWPAARIPATTLSVTVQGRIVLVYGCAAEPGVAEWIEAFARSLPNVQLAVAAIRTAATERPPYRLARPAGAQQGR